MQRRGVILLILLAGPTLLWAGRPAASSGSSDDRAKVARKIDKTQARLKRARRQAGVLSTDVARASALIHALRGRISSLQRQQDAIEPDLARQQGTLDRLQGELRVERSRLASLRAKLSQARVVLARRLRDLYTSQPPDIVTVVLSSKGFADLLERSEFMRRINDQDARVVRSARIARTVAQSSANRLATLERRQQQITRRVLARRNQIATVKYGLVAARSRYASARARRADQLRRVRREHRGLMEDLASLQREQAKIEGRLQGGLVGGPIRKGSGRFIWPITGTITSLFCERRSYESCHPGLDIAAPTGTPIRAPDAGQVSIAGWQGGYGNFTCLRHSGSLATCYGHQSAINVRVGQAVSQGQVIGLVGSTGHSTGPHLHFEVRVNGSVTNPMSYL